MEIRLFEKDNDPCRRFSNQSFREIAQIFRLKHKVVYVTEGLTEIFVHKCGYAVEPQKNTILNEFVEELNHEGFYVPTLRMYDLLIASTIYIENFQESKLQKLCSYTLLNY